MTTNPMPIATPDLSISDLSGGAILNVDLLPGGGVTLRISLSGVVTSGTRDLGLLRLEEAPAGYFICEVIGVQEPCNPIAYPVSFQDTFAVDDAIQHVVVLYRDGDARKFLDLPLIVLREEDDAKGMQPVSSIPAAVQPMATGYSTSLDFNAAYQDALKNLMGEVAQCGYRESFGIAITGQRLVQTAIPVSGFPRLEVSLQSSGVEVEKKGGGHPGA